ncbi:microtubule-associated protein futsch [Uranotaenia lowii]|uniref:microtubule-associated protein futsch n=1 Tax=Uranotaenia lowii TaxID=190385 RepID=UPI00247AA7F0|nr:microtubule-associated protein futsch [Uranotaenia lowii]
MLSSFTRHRHIIHTGYTFAGNGSWVLQDGTFSVVDFMEAFQEHEVQRVLRAYPDTITMDVHCATVGNWAAIQEKSFARLCRIRLNPVDVLSSGSDKLNAFVDYLASMIVPTEISELLESSDVVGNIRFSHPTLYVFPGGQGDAALFGINGFNMLVDGGFSRKSCFWDFVRHLDRLDAVLMTRINNTNIKGISAVVERKNEAHVYPQIGHFFCNIPERKGLLSPDGDKDRDPLLVDLIEEGHQIVTNLKSLNLKAQNCYRDADPINLYHKVGHGTLDMYVISPAKDSKEVKDFIAKWHAADSRLFAPKDSKEFTFPMQNIISICALLVWTPANPEDNITRILFPGSAPEYKILEGLEKIKNVEFMRHPVCTVKSIAPSISTQTITKKSLKSSSIDKIIPEPILPSKVTKPSEKDNKIIDNKMKMIDNKLAESVKSASDTMDSSADEAKLEKHITKSTVATAKIEASKTRSFKTKSVDVKKVDNKIIESGKKSDADEKKDSASDAGSEKDDTEKKVTAEVISEKQPDQDKEKKDDDIQEIKKVESPTAKDDTKVTKKINRPATTRSRIDSKPPVKTSKPIKKKEEITKSSPTTPKKTAEPKLTNGTADKKDEEPKKSSTGPPKTTRPASSKPGKASPKSTPAKSAKDANNRKVLEARQRPIAKAPSVPKPAAEKKEAAPKVERKPISRRPKGAAPSTATGGSPIKAKKVLKSEKDAVIRKAKLDKNGTTDSSLVSTPSADEAVVAVHRRIADTAAAGAAGSIESTSDIDTMQQQQLAELKEEQEAVREIEAVFQRDLGKGKHRELLDEHREIHDSATEPEEEEEYLIIEKEEQYTEDSVNEHESSATKEEEIQKHQRDSQESEKRKRDSIEDEKEKEDAGKEDDGEAAAVVEVIEGEAEVAEKAEEEEIKETDDKEAEEADKEEVKGKFSPKHKQDLEEEVQDIIASAKEIAKSKMETSMDGLKTEEMSSISPDDKISSTKKTSDTRDEAEPEPVHKEQIGPPHESHHEERISATAESGATTTAPTLPEDERIPLDEIKEDLVIEEKHVKEETKEVEVAPPLPTVYEPLERPTPAKMQFSAQQAHMRDVVKTPDEVADLPVHEEADFEEYSEDKDKEDEKEHDTKEKPEALAQKKETEETTPEKTDKVVADKSAESDKLCDTVKNAQDEVKEEIIEKVDKDLNVEKPPKLEPQTAAAKVELDDEAILKDLESQIIAQEDVIKKQPEITKTQAKPVTPAEGHMEIDTDEDKKSVHEEEIIPTKVEPKVPMPAETSILDEIWSAPQKAEEKLDVLKQIIDDKAKETTSELVTMKDEMVKQVVEQKDEIIETMKAEIEDTVVKLGEQAEKTVIAKTDDVLAQITSKTDAINTELQDKAKQMDENIASGVEAVKEDVAKKAAKADEILSTIAIEKQELEKLAKDIKEEVSGKLDETKKQLEEEINQTVEKAQEKAKTGISSFFGGISEGIKSGIEKIADKVETKIKDKTEQVEARLQEVTDKIEELKAKEVVEEVCEKVDTSKQPSSEAGAFEPPFGFERTFTQELRETHITTVDSPVGEVDKLKCLVNIPQHIDEDKELEEIESNKIAASYVIEEVKYSAFEDANLREIKEEEEEDRTSPPQKDDKKFSSPKLEPIGVPPRARTPEDVAKIVANVAEVLKSDKGLEEIIPGFDAQELERRLSQGTATREEDVGTVQRMLVTASSEDGGEEIDICPPGTITFSKSATPEPTLSGKITPEIKVEDESEEAEESEDEKPEKPKLPEIKPEEKTSPASSGKSSPELKTSPTSIEEKDKHELPEKVVSDAKKPAEKVAEDRKESLVEQHMDLIDDSRRESAFSTFSERDYTKDESSIVDERDSSRAHSISSHISDLKEDAADVKAVTDFLKESEKADQEVFADSDKLQKDTAPTSKQADELSSPESVTSQKTVSEKSLTEQETKMDESVLVATDKVSRPESVASHVSEKADTKLDAQTSRPESAASHLSEKSATKIDAKSEGDAAEGASRPESAASRKDDVDAKPDSKTSRPESVASHISDKDQAKHESPPESVKAHIDEEMSADKPEGKLDDKKEESIEKSSSRAESVASHVSDTVEAAKTEEKDAQSISRPISAASHVSDSTKGIEEKTQSRPESVASNVSEASKPIDVKKEAEQKDASRPESVASHVSEKAPSDKMEAKDVSRPESQTSHIDEKLAAAEIRPESVASHTSEKEASEQKISQADQIEEKLTFSRPASVANHKPIVTDDLKVDESTVSRPQSVASHVSEKGSDLKDESIEKPDSRPASAISHTSDKDPKQESSDKGDILKVSTASLQTSPADKETSRPQSAASHVSDKTTDDKSGPAVDDKQSTKGESRPESVASHVSEKAPSEKSTHDAEDKLSTKTESRPESVGSHVSEKAPSEKSAQATEDKLSTKAESRPESVASHVSEKATEQPTSGADDKSPTKTHESRPESAASHVEEKAESEKSVPASAKAESRPESVASHVSDKVTQETADKTSSKGESRPDSVASHVSEKAPSEKSTHDAEDKLSTKAESRPESVASHVSEKAPSEKSAQATEEKLSTKAESRPESAASHVSEKAPSDKSAQGTEDKLSAKAESRPESAASHVSEKAPSEKSAQGTEDKLPTKVESRPESAASHVSEKASSDKFTKDDDDKLSTKAESRPDSAASHVSEKAPSDKSAQGIEDKLSTKAESRPESAASHVSEKAPSEKSAEATEDKLSTKAESRPESAASHVSEKAPSEKSTKGIEDKLSAKAESRPESAASHVSEKASSDKSAEGIEDKLSTKAESRPESAASHISEKVPSEKSAQASEDKLSTKAESRPESAASHVSEKSAQPVDDKASTKTESRPESAAAETDSKLLEKTESRPQSVASHISEKSTTEKAEEKIIDKEISRPESATSHVSEKLEAKDTSRPSSVASHVSDKTADEGKKTEEQRPESVASHVSDKPASETDAKEKEASRPESAVSQAEQKDASSRPVSVASHTSELAKLDDKDQSRPESVADDKSPMKELKPDDKAGSRPESVASGTKSPAKDEKEVSRPASATQHIDDSAATTKVVEQSAGSDFSRPDSPASCSSDKHIPAKEPESFFVEKDLARQDSNASYHGEPIPGEKSFSRPESPASCAEDEGESTKDAKPSQISEKETEINKKVEKVEGAITEETSKEAMDEPKDFSRPESPDSCGADEATTLPKQTTESTIPEKDLARKDSSASYHGEPIPDEKQFSRPDSPSSCGGEESETKLSRPESAAKEQSRPESAASHISEKDTKTVAKTDIKTDEKDSSRPVSAASHVSDKSAASAKAESKQSFEEVLSHRESGVNGERPTSALSDHSDSDEKIVKKESRSKSMSAVTATTTQRIGFEGSALGILEETMATSRDDLHILKTPRDSVTKIEELTVKEKHVEQTSESKVVKELFGSDQFPSEVKEESKGFPVVKSEPESPDQVDSVIPAVDQLLKETSSSMKEIEKMSSSIITKIQSTEKKEESVKVEEKSSSLAFPLLDSGKSSPMSLDKDKSQTSSIKSVSPHEKDSLEGSSVSLNTFIEKDSLSETVTKQVTIKSSAVDASSSVVQTTTSKVESSELLGGAKTPPTAPISPNVIKEDFGLRQQVESTIASSTTTAVTSSSTSVKQQKDDVSGISTPKESVPSGKSSPGLMSVHTGSTDSASKSINFGHSSGIETSESSPKPTSPFPKVVDTLKTDEVKTTSGMSTPDMTRTSTPEMIDSQIECIADEKKESATSATTITTTTTTTKRYIIKDGEKIEVGTSVHTEVSGDAKKEDTSTQDADSMSTSTSLTTTTTTKVIKEPAKAPANLTLSSTEDRDLTEEYDDKDGMSPRSDISSGQASRIVAGWHDEDAPGSPMSVTSQAPLSPSTKYTYDFDLQHSSSGVSKKSDIEIDESQDDIPPQYGSEEVKSAISLSSGYKPDPMSTSFYGQLPDISDTAVTTASSTTKSVPIPISTGKAFTKTYMEYASSGDSSVDSSHHRPSSDRKYLDEADLDFEKTFTKPGPVDLMTTSMHFSSEKEFMAATTAATSAITTFAESQKKELDFTASGLPSQAQSTQQQSSTTAQSSSSTTTATSSSSTTTTTTSQEKDPLALWGKPLGLPSPAPAPDDNMKTTPKKERKMLMSKTRLNNEKNLRKRSESPNKATAKKPVYVDLSYVPHHGNSYYANVEFFKRVRARYYVFSGTEPSREVYNALLEAKQTWEDKELEVTIIPTYDTDVLGYWVSENEDLLAKYHIDLSPSAARCTINLQDHETSCSAYRLEF